jgi:hypothetical protein
MQAETDTKNTAGAPKEKKWQQCARLLPRRSAQCISRYKNIAAVLQSKANKTNRENNLRNPKKRFAALEL